MRMAFIGAPGAGKSTQAKRVARSLLYPNHSPRFSSRDLVRAEVEASKSTARAQELRVAALLVREEAEAVAREEGEAPTRMIAENLSLEAQG
jgi:adenylate kinase family enzyme